MLSRVWLAWSWLESINVSAENLRQQGLLLLAASFEYKKLHLDAHVGEREGGTEVVFAG